VKHLDKKATGGILRMIQLGPISKCLFLVTYMNNRHSMQISCYKWL